MSMTDPIADMFTRIRNARLTGKRAVRMPSSRVKKAIAELLKNEGYVAEFQVQANERSSTGLAFQLSPLRPES